mmetsp:Transcript_81362/g.154433  ORF Transcript_81362/g.154433 Transcript_81362/m.154433 type:complete len:335 (+) Transcript_81362:119-1123(+)
MGVPDDANPLNRRLPAEVVSRRRKPERKEPEEEAPLIVDRAQVLAMKPEQRVKWLSKAFQRGQEGKVQMTTIYDIVAHTKFAGGASDKFGHKMYRVVHSNLSLFSQKQQRFLESECKLAKDFKEYKSRAGQTEAAEDGEDAEDAAESSALLAGGADGGAESAAAAAAAGDGVAWATANGSASAGSDPPGVLSLEEIPALWDRITKLTVAQCEEAIQELDPITKSRLEDFLEARMKARRTAAPATSAEVSGHAASAPSGGRASRSRSKRRSRSNSSARKEDAKGRRAKENDRSKRGRSSSGSSSRRSSSSSASSDPKRRRKASKGRREQSRRGRR